MKRRQHFRHNTPPEQVHPSSQGLDIPNFPLLTSSSAAATAALAALAADAGLGDAITAGLLAAFVFLPPALPLDSAAAVGVGALAFLGGAGVDDDDDDGGAC